MSLDLGKSGSYMRSISIGKALPSMHEFLRICEYLGVTPQEFFTGAGDETDRINIFNRLQDLDDGDIQKLQTFLGWMFKNTLLLAQQGNEKAMEKLLNRYDPLLKKCSIIQGHFDEDLYQSLILEFVRAVSAFKI